jgi:hypothetical protein
MEVWKYGTASWGDLLDNSGLTDMIFMAGRHDGTFVHSAGFTGLVTQFSYEIVPEQTSLKLVLLAFLLWCPIGYYHRIRRMR